MIADHRDLNPMAFPELIVFDLDFTLWTCGGTYCDCLTPPFHVDEGRVYDRDRHQITMYAEVPDIMDRCDGLGIPMALASRTEEPEWARHLLQLLGIDMRFELSEIYPGSKLQHFEALKRASGVDFSQMLFFDDEQRNIVEVSRLGVTSVYVDRGMAMSVFEQGMNQAET